MIARAAATATIALACGALAQQPPPVFAAPNLSAKGVRAMAAGCAPCHGTDGHAAPGSEVAGLAGRPRGEIAQAMVLFREGRKPGTVMGQLARGFTDAEVAAMDEYFSQQRQRGAAAQ